MTDYDVHHQDPEDEDAPRWNITGRWTARAHAKVNLHLGVGEAREDGFHELATVFQSLQLHDTVTYEPSTKFLTLSVDGPHAAGVPTDENNLAWMGMRFVSLNFGVDFPRGHLHLHKQIPAAGGMAGGSADAAAAMKLGSAAWATITGKPEAAEEHNLRLAGFVGSDVPFTWMGGTALGHGRGELLTPMMSRGEYIWAIVTHQEGLSTPAVFRKLDELRAVGRGSEPHMDTTAVGQALISGDPHALAAALHNDLQVAALSLRPDLRKVLDTGKAAGALQGIISGSGPTCAFLCEDEETALEVIAQVTADNRGTSGLVTRGPAPGAEVVEEVYPL
ncbi:4-(cytidine 5'-diphospho)-2-C-methyl-D-erythritol kinase [Corynebacterium sp.]|uniref:4-(cytidine 5'-diphospho)-2-C-methyl-D-erythritol kinase n=1 Tax=Corynebacterium sp. TaxID=1720 RepID=UPI0026DBE95D|nr:4-(cytidine 5'-diphospho)-2-C-methyl-D-erythritol kinase [Corynebacterium sp.]MDO5033019.1 4-(cytidine 5'-diphospho)-2-C-methyl-D-erythritol kinase [Corynebacterium sp.]